jgi:hypothetical protein
MKFEYFDFYSFFDSLSLILFYLKNLDKSETVKFFELLSEYLELFSLSKLFSKFLWFNVCYATLLISCLYYSISYYKFSLNLFLFGKINLLYPKEFYILFFLFASIITDFGLSSFITPTD